MSGAVEAAADRAPTPCPACGQTVRQGRKPHGYGKTHCQRCADEIEQRHAFHTRRNGGGRR